jgi:UDP-N-acetylmuramoyl-L-alanyl-D-glutamate--2,6-diaminopimelate ligase
VLEVSSHAVSLDRIAGCEFAVKVFTNFTQDHLDFHGTMDEYYAAKKAFFTGYDGTNIINLDDPRGADLASGSKGRTLTYAINEKADIRATGITLGQSGIEFTMEGPQETVAVKSPLVGRHNVYNILAAAGACIAAGITPAEVSSGIAGMREVAGRMEKVDAGQDFVVLVDYAHTEDALERVLATAREFTPGRLITVFGCGGDRDKTKRPRMGRAAARLSDIVVLTSDNPRTEPPQEILAQAEAGIIEEGSKARGSGYFILEDRAESIDFAIGAAKAGDTVLIAGKGHEDYQIIGGRKFHFDDRESARQSLLKRLKCA